MNPIRTLTAALLFGLLALPGDHVPRAFAATGDVLEISWQQLIPSASSTEAQVTVPTGVVGHFRRSSLPEDYGKLGAIT